MKPGHFSVAAGALFLAGCVMSVENAGPPQYDSASFDRGKLEELRLDLNMGAGNLKVGTGTHKLAQAYFSYNVPDWKPIVRFEPQGATGSLSIRQPDTHHVRVNHNRYEWDLRLNEDVPVYLRANFGAGHAQLDLGSLALREVEVDMGVGQLTMDLRGNPKHDYSVRINGGVGEATVRLPSNVGVYAEAAGGIGSIEARNLHRSGGHWENDAYAGAKVRIHVNVQGGVGSIKLIGE